MTDKQKIEDIVHQIAQSFSGADSLFALQDVKYGDFNWKMLPGIERERIIGVRTPALKKLAKELAKDPQIGDFLHSLPHTYNEEYTLHDFIIAQTKDFSTCIAQVEELLPYIDNWGVCDQLSPQCFKRHREELLPYIDRWLQSPHPYIVRFGLESVVQEVVHQHLDAETHDVGVRTLQPTVDVRQQFLPMTL